MGGAYWCGGGTVNRAYVEYAYRLRFGRRDELRVDCALTDFPRRLAVLRECRSAYELVWARVVGSLV